MWKLIVLCIGGACYGLLAAAGVFTVFVAVGLIPRFAGRTGTEKKICLYEEMVIWGTLFGCAASVFSEYFQIGLYIKNIFPDYPLWSLAVEGVLQSCFGVFGGIFVGCLALTIAEMMDSIPIFARRISFRAGLSAAVFGMALGKLAGSLFYFEKEFGR